MSFMNIITGKVYRGNTYFSLTPGFLIDIEANGKWKGSHIAALKAVVITAGSVGRKLLNGELGVKGFDHIRDVSQMRELFLSLAMAYGLPFIYRGKHDGKFLFLESERDRLAGRLHKILRPAGWQQEEWDRVYQELSTVGEDEIFNGSAQMNSVLFQMILHTGGEGLSIIEYLALVDFLANVRKAVVAIYYQNLHG